MNEPEIENILYSLRNIAEAQPREEFVRNARIRVLNLVPSQMLIDKIPWLPRLFLRWGLAVAAAVSLLGGGLVYAAQFSSPGGTLYSLKRASERVALDFSPTGTIKTMVAAGVVDRRAQEVGSIEKKEDAKAAASASAEFRLTVDQVRRMPGINHQEVEDHINEHKSLLPEVKGAQDSQRNSSESNETDGHNNQEHENTNERNKEIPSIIPSPTPGTTATPTPAKTQQEHHEHGENQQGERQNTQEDE